MNLKEITLKKEELPILHQTCFQIPIHPKLLNSNIQINENLAQKLFPLVAKEWYEDLKKYSPKDNEEKEWINQIYLKHKPKITKEFNHQYLNEFWKDEIQTKDNGLVTCFSISRNGGGSLYFNQDDSNCESFGIMYIKFSEEKKKEFQIENEFNRMNVYAQHNIDHYPGALFLRNWAIMYMNEVFKEIF
jgi:hypothetical protein